MSDGPLGASGLPPPLTDTSPAGLAQAIEADSIGTRVLGSDLPSRPHLDVDASWVEGEPMDPYMNTVASARFAPETADRRIAEIMAAYEALPSPFVWWRAPFHTPGDLAARLERAHIYSVGEAPAMAMDLATLGPAPEVEGRFEIRGVTDVEGLDAYMAILNVEPPADGAPPLYPPEKAQRMRDALSPRLAAEPAPLRVLGYLDGRPVATARLSVAGGTAGLYAVATLEEARGHGYGAAVSHACLATGRDLGYRIATLQATEMGYGIYRRLGFVEQFRYTVHVHVPGGARLAG